MTNLPFSIAGFSVAVAVFVIVLSVLICPIHALGSGSTLAVSYGSGTVCGIVAEQPTRRIECFRNGRAFLVEPNISFSSICGGRNFFCGLRTGGYSVHCWDYRFSDSTFSRKRIYVSDSVLLDDIAIGDDQICATVRDTGGLNCWREGNDLVKPRSGPFASISSGFGFSCGILKNGSVRCWGNNSIADQIETGFRNTSMLSIVAGGSHACGIDTSGSLICRGNNDTGQLNNPTDSELDFSELALGESHTCGIRRQNRSVVCWGGGQFSADGVAGISFERIVSGSNFTCGLTTSNLSVVCWGAGWPNSSGSNSWPELPVSKILPGPCVLSPCSDCGIYPLSQTLCSGSGNICQECAISFSLFPPPLSEPPTSPSSPSPPSSFSKSLFVFAIVGSVGSFVGICTIVYCLWTGVCFGNKKVHNSVQPQITRTESSNGGTTSSTNKSQPSRSSTIKRQGSRLVRRQRSGTSTKHAERAEEFSFADLATATNNFCANNKLGAGSFGTVYRGKLQDGREVAIKRGETGTKTKKFQEKESAFDSEVAFSSRLHHKHLVGLVGYCEERDERLLVYEYMKNGALYDHLHDKNNTEKSSSAVNSWKTRIKIALDAARGIEYLHNYAVPPIIHRDIKSSNILLDSTWTARVSDFGLSLMSPESMPDYRPTKAAGTVGYIDPEYYGLNVLTAKSDVYGLGVVLLELLTGKRAIFKNGPDEELPVCVVDFAVPPIMMGEMGKVLDPRVGSPELNVAEAVELMGYTAMHCVNMEGKERPTMADIVANLERALALCDGSHGSISSDAMSIVSE